MDKRKLVRGKFPETQHAVLSPKPKKYYMKYSERSYETDKGIKYEITASYFLYKGNILSDSAVLKTEQFEYSEEKSFLNKTLHLDNHIEKTINKFITELNNIGASRSNAIRILKQRGF